MKIMLWFCSEPGLYKPSKHINEILEEVRNNKHKESTNIIYHKQEFQPMLDLNCPQQPG